MIAGGHEAPLDTELVHRINEAEGENLGFDESLEELEDVAEVDPLGSPEESRFQG